MGAGDRGPRGAARPLRHRAGARRVQGPRVPLRDPGRHHDLEERRRDPAATRSRSSSATRARSVRSTDQYDTGLISQEERHEAVVEKWTAATDEVGQAMQDNLRSPEPHLHDGQLRRPWLVQADPPAGGHARPDGQPEGRDHRAPDQGQLHGGPDRARVLHLDPRRPQGPGRHRAPHGRLGLPHPPPRGRRPGRDRPRGGLRHQGDHRGARCCHADGSAQRVARGPLRGQGGQDQARPLARSTRAT